MTETAKTKTVAILGAGPVGLAAAAHVLERGLEPVVLEAGPTVGHAVRQWSHVQIFSPWDYNIDKAAERLLVASGWNKPQPDHYPTGAELLEQYLEPLAMRTPLKDRIRTRSMVTSVGRIGFDKVKTKGREAAPFEIRYQNGKGPETLQRRRGDRCDGHLVRAQSGRRQRPAGDRRARVAGPHRLRHARRAGPRPRALCRPERSPCWAPATPRSAR